MGTTWPGKREIKAQSHGLRRRKNCALFVAGTVTDLFVPSSMMVALFGISSPAWPACSLVASRPKTRAIETIAICAGGQAELPPAGRQAVGC